MAFFSLKIRVIDPDLNNRNMFNDVLGQIGQPDVLLQKDARELFDRDQPLPCELVFINADLDYGLSAPDVIRYLTRADLVPAWCKFVIVSNQPGYNFQAPIFRYLQTEILTLPASFDKMRYLIYRTISSIKTFRPILNKLHKISPNQLVKLVTEIKLKQKDPIMEDEMLVMKLQLLMQAKRPDLALKLAHKIKDDISRFRELSYVSLVTGQEDELQALIKQAQKNKQFLFGRVYLQSYLALTEQDFRKALRCFERLPVEILRGNDAMAYSLLLHQCFGRETAIDYINKHMQRVANTSMTYSSLISTKLQILFMTLIADNALDEAQRSDIFMQIQDLAEHRIWQKQDYKYHAYAPFIELGMSLVAGHNVAEETFETLLLQIDKLDISQLNILLFAANKLKRDNASMEIHDKLEQNLAKVEVSPELISFMVVNDIVLRTTMTPERLKYRLEYIGFNHWQKGRHYRALARFKELISRFEHSPENERQMLRLIKESGLKRYWRYALS